MTRHGPGDHSPESSRTRHRIVARTLEVRRIEPLSPRMVRVALVGEQLRGFPTAAPTDHVRVFFPHGDRPPTLPVVVDGRPRMIGEVDPHRTYTVRRFRPEPGELEIDIVLHGEGVATDWVARARPGSQVGVLGPPWSLPAPKGCDGYLFAVDATGLPATERWLEELPPGARATVVAQVADRAEERDLHTEADLDLRWVHDGGPTLEDAVRAIDFGAGAGYVWAAGEAEAVAPLRTFLHRERGLTPDQCDVQGYWRRGTVARDHLGPPVPS